MDQSIFDMEVREKQNQRFNLKAKTGARGGSKSRKGVRTSYDFMKPSEKRKLNGEVEVSFMYETIIPFSEFKLKNIDLQKTMLERWRELFDNKKIMNEMGLTNGQYYKLVGTLDIQKKAYDTEKRKETMKKAREAKARLAAEPKEEQITVELPEPQLEIVQEPVKLISKGMYLEYNGSYDAEAISKIFTKLQLLVDGEPNKFKLNICISEEV